MNTQVIVLALMAALLGAGCVYLYSQHGELDREIALTSKQCEQQVAELNARYQAEIDDLRRYVLEQYNTNTDPGLKPEAKPRFDQLVSHRHRVQAVSAKYDFLLETALISDAEKKELRRLLLERERLANLVNVVKDEIRSTSDIDPQQLQTDLDNVESQIQVLLQDPLDYQRYEVLRQREL